MSISPFRAAVVQAASDPAGSAASAAKAARLVAEAAAAGARLAVFPEAFIGGYPKGARFGAPVGLRLPEGREAYARYFAASVALEAVPEDGRMATVDLDAKPSVGGTFVAAWSPESIGRWKIRPRDPSLAARAGDGTVLEVSRSDRELRDAEADRPLLESLARETGGRVVNAADAAELVRTLPNRSIRTENPIRDPLWNSPGALLLVISVLASEWIVRRTARLI